MLGLMQDWPLRIHSLIDHAARHHGGRRVVSRSVEGPFHETDWRTLRGRALRLAQRLSKEGVRPGDRIATMAWNTWRHVEAWYGITGASAVYHTLNPRLFPEQIRVDPEPRGEPADAGGPHLVPLLEKLAAQLRM
jgi:fatty-acyl-CoA synthase